MRLKDWYLSSIRSNALGDDPNRVRMFSFKTGQWFILKEKVFDFALYGDVVLCCDDSLYEMFRGDYGSDSKYVIKGFFPPGYNIGASTVMSGVSFLMHPSTSNSADMVISGRRSGSKGESDSFVLLPSDSRISFNKRHDDYWNKPSAVFDETRLWSGPDEVWITPVTGKPVEGTSFDISITFPADSRIKLRALKLSLSEQARSQ